jgi:hypothetical protein
MADDSAELVIGGELRLGGHGHLQIEPEGRGGSI